MVVGGAHVFPGFFKPVLTLLSFQSHRLLFSHAFSRGERQKYLEKKVRLNRISNSQPPGHESDTLTTELPERVELKESRPYGVLLQTYSFQQVTLQVT